METFFEESFQGAARFATDPVNTKNADPKNAQTPEGRGLSGLSEEALSCAVQLLAKPGLGPILEFLAQLLLGRIVKVLQLQNDPIAPDPHF